MKFKLVLGLQVFLVFLLVSCNLPRTEAVPTHDLPTATPAPVGDTPRPPTPVVPPEKSPTPRAATLALTATATPISFSSAQSNNVPPEDVLEEVSFFQEGGGGSILCPAEGGLSFCVAPDQVEWLGDIYFVIQGGEQDARLDVTILAPDGTKLPDTGEQQWREVGEDVRVNAILYTFPITPEMTAGDYRFVFNLPNGRLEKTVNVFQPAFPGVRKLPRESKLILFNFAPLEPVRLFIYRRLEGTASLRFLGWGIYQVDKEGFLAVHIAETSGDYYYFVVGPQSGPVSANGIELKEGFLKP